MDLLLKKSTVGRDFRSCFPLSTGKNLQAQYERWQPKAKYKTHLDPTVDDVKKLAQSCRWVAWLDMCIACEYVCILVMRVNLSTHSSA